MKNIKKRMPLPIDTIVPDEDCQQAFEAWMEKQSWPTQERHEGGYRDDIVHTFWRGWQACWAELKLIRSTPAEREDRERLAEALASQVVVTHADGYALADIVIAAGWRKGEQ